MPIITCLMQVADHWQTLIAGVFALIAGWVAYRAGLRQARATITASNEQLAADARKDRQQARCIAVGISPDLLQLEAAHAGAVAKIGNLATLSSRNTDQLIVGIQDAKIAMPPVLARVIDQVYILGEPAGPTVLQLIAVVYQFNYILDRNCGLFLRDSSLFNPTGLQQELAGQLTAIGQLIPMAQQETERLHAEATAGARS